MLLNKMLKRPILKLYAPMEGEIIPLEEVADPVFSEKMMGDGIAIMPTNGTVLAPADGIIIQIAPTKHAIGIRTEDGAEILIHVGLDTVELAGQPFTVHVVMGETVTLGQQLLTADLQQIHQAGKDTVTPMIVTNSNELTQTYSFNVGISSIPAKTIVAQVD